MHVSNSGTRCLGQEHLDEETDHIKARGLRQALSQPEAGAREDGQPVLTLRRCLQQGLATTCSLERDRTGLHGGMSMEER